MFPSRISFAIVSQVIRSIILLQWITVTVVSSVGAVNEKMPTAAKLTISIDQVSPALPPQIAYFIPDSALNNFLNRTICDGPAANRTRRCRPNMMPPNGFNGNGFNGNGFGPGFNGNGFGPGFNGNGFGPGFNGNGFGPGFNGNGFNGNGFNGNGFNGNGFNGNGFNGNGFNGNGFNGNGFNGNGNGNAPVRIRNRNRNNNNNDDSFENSFEAMVDSMAAPQSKYRYVVIPQNHNQDYTTPSYDAEAAYQDLNYKINFKPSQDKKSIQWSNKAYEDEDDGITKASKKHGKKEKRPSPHKYQNHHPTSIRDQLNYLKKNHRDQYADDTAEHDDTDDEDSERIIDGRGVTKKRQKKKKVPRKKQRAPPRYVPTSSYENDERLPPYFAVPTTPHHNHNRNRHHNHKDCDSNEQNRNNQGLAANGGDYDDDEEENYPVQSTVVPQRRKKSRNKNLTYYITKVRDPDANNERMLRLDNLQNKDEDDVGAETAFVPTRYLASVRGIEKTVHKKKHQTPEKAKKPRVKERLIESGGHIVYTEDGYEDKEYDHGSQEKLLRYHHRSRRETQYEVSEPLPEASELKGQELLDHISGLLKNASDTLTTVDGELNQRGRFPFYNSNRTILKESPLRYAEHDKPFRANGTNSYYDTKTKPCSEIDDDVNVTTDEPDPASPPKRLKNLGSRIDCVKEKLFGENPLDNPIFDEVSVSEPTAEAVFETDSSVYTDVMHNIGVNKNQRVFSNYGISDHYDLSAADTLAVKNRPENTLNTYEKYPRDDINDSMENGNSAASVKENELYKKSAFNNPAQVPILDISKFIPRPRPYLPAPPHFESDFVPVTATTGRTEPTTHMVPPKVQAVPVKIPVLIPVGSKPYYRKRRHPPRKSGPGNKKRLPPNVFVVRRGQNMAYMRVPPPNKPR